MKTMKVKLTFIDEVLGTASADPEIHANYIASKAPDAPTREEEVAALGAEEVIHLASTVFPRNKEGIPILWDYQIKGFFKAKCSALKKVEGTKSGKCKAFKKQIDELIFVKPREIPLIFEGETGTCQRPLRAETAQGARVALANSETVPEGATCQFEVICFNDSDMDMVREWLDHGEWNGLLQWRNGGKGRFIWEEIQ